MTFTTIGDKMTGAFVTKNTLKTAINNLLTNAGIDAEIEDVVFFGQHEVKEDRSDVPTDTRSNVSLTMKHKHINILTLKVIEIFFFGSHIFVSSNNDGKLEVNVIAVCVMSLS